MSNKKPVDTTKEDVLSFFNRANRPYNVQNVIDALRSKKSLVVKALDDLEGNNQIQCKNFGKVKIYLAKQTNIKTVTAEEAVEMEQTILTMTSELNVFNLEKKALITEIGSIEQFPTDKNLEEVLTLSVPENEKLTIKLAQISDGKILVCPEDKKRVEAEYTFLRQQWRKRKKMCCESLGEVCGDKKLCDIREELGVVTDEEVASTIGEDIALNTAIKKSRF